MPVALKKNLPGLLVTAIDVSEGALNTAVKNAVQQDVQVSFMRLDFLDENAWNNLDGFDIVISNPPYVKRSEAASMNKNVLEYEPHLALFVPDEDALLFYRKIAAFGKTHLSANGTIFLKINEALGNDVEQLFNKAGYTTELKKDMQGKERMIKAKLN